MASLLLLVRSNLYMKKLAAEDASYRVIGVKAVVNDIEVQLPSLAERTDLDLAAAVLNSLNWDAGIQQAN